MRDSPAWSLSCRRVWIRELAIRVFRTLRELRLKVEQNQTCGMNSSGPLSDSWRRSFVLCRTTWRSPAFWLPSPPVSRRTSPSRLVFSVGWLRSDLAPLHLTHTDLERRLHAYLKNSVDLVLGQDDFNGEHKAHLVHVSRQLGHPEDMDDLVRLIHADIDRMPRGRDARAAGDQGPVGNGAIMTQAGWNIAAVKQLDGAESERVSSICCPSPSTPLMRQSAMASDFLPKPERAFDRTFRYELMWGAREGRIPPPTDNWSARRRLRRGTERRNQAPARTAPGRTTQRKAERARQRAGRH